MRGDAARSYLDIRIASYERDIDAVLAPYHPVSAVQSWRAEIPAAEEMNAPRFSIDSVSTRRQIA